MDDVVRRMKASDNYPFSILREREREFSPMCLQIFTRFFQREFSVSATEQMVS